MSAQNKKGFTLIELLVTIAIIAILVSIGAVVYSATQKSARVSKRLQDLESIKVALEIYKNLNNKYPNSAAAQTGGCIATNLTELVPSAIQALPKDPSENLNPAYCYIYKSNASGTEYKVRTGIGIAYDMTSPDYNTQPNYVDPARDNGAAGGANSCLVDGNTPTAWAVYSSLGQSSTNSCAY